MTGTEQRARRWHGRRPGRRNRWVARGGRGGRPAFVLLVALAALVALFARDPEFRSAVWAFIRSL